MQLYARSMPGTPVSTRFNSSIHPTISFTPTSATCVMIVTTLELYLA
ncbi:hypothetical protein RSAG8_02904, partial [Rhizoctonia solani AG-8 WAC10335]